MISEDDAVTAAFNTFHSLYKSASVKNPLLEGFEKGPEGKYFTVAIGFDVMEVHPLSALDRLAGTLGTLRDVEYRSGDSKMKMIRKYKYFTIDSTDGSLVKMEGINS